jgi:hypothetical protein
MASKKALEAMDHDDWIIVTEMLDKGELSTEDLNMQHDTEYTVNGGEYS